MKYFESFNTYNNIDDNLIVITEYVLLLSEILDDIKSGFFVKNKLVKLLTLNTEITLNLLPINIKNILIKQQKDFKTLSLVINKLKIKKSEYNQKVSEKEILKNWIKDNINKL